MEDSVASVHRLEELVSTGDEVVDLEKADAVRVGKAFGERSLGTGEGPDRAVYRVPMAQQVVDDVPREEPGRAYMMPTRDADKRVGGNIYPNRVVHLPVTRTVLVMLFHQSRTKGARCEVGTS